MRRDTERLMRRDTARLTKTSNETSHLVRPRKQAVVDDRTA